MKKSRLTEKSMSNKRFSGNEKSIFVAICRCEDYPSVKKLCRLAHISRNTFYNHHAKVQTVISDYETYVLDKYTKVVKKHIKNKAELRLLIFRTLIFIYHYREVFRLLFKHNYQEIVKRMFEFLEPSVADNWHLAGDLAKMYNVYVNEVLGVIETWANQGFPKESLDQVLSDIMYLTDNAHQQLLPIK